MLFNHFEPARTLGVDLVDREPVVKWLKQHLDHYLEGTKEPVPRPGKALCLLGPKGSGKTLLARTALRGFRQQWSDRVLFIEVDCRNVGDARAALGKLATDAQSQLGDLAAIGAPLREQTRDLAGILVEVTRYPEVEKRVVQERIISYSAAAKLEARSEFLKRLGISFGLGVTRDRRETQQMIGSVRFDEPRLVELARGFIADLRDQQIPMVLFLDNVDELRHQYFTQEQRDQVREQLAWLLQLRDQSPLFMLLCLRDYFDGVWNRTVTDKRPIGALPPEYLEQVLTTHLGDEAPATRETFARPEVSATVHRLAALAPTPFAFLSWVYFAAEQEMLGEPIDKIATAWVRIMHSSQPERAIRAAVEAFRKAESESVSREALLAALDGSELLLKQLQDSQVLLPRDFWNPTEFTLDPQVRWLRSPAEAT